MGKDCAEVEMDIDWQIAVAVMGAVTAALTLATRTLEFFQRTKK